MNHDVAHCGDYDPMTCPKTCYRAQVTADLYARADMVGVLVSFIDFRTNGDQECPLAPSYAPAKPKSWGEYIRSADDAELATLFGAKWMICPKNKETPSRCRKFGTCPVCWAAYLKEATDD